MTNPITQYLMMGKLVALLGAIALICWQSSQIHRWHQNATSCAEARKTDRTAYETAQAQAALTNQKQVAEENKLRAQISDHSRSDYLADRDRLRSQAPQSPAKPTSASGLPQAPPGTASEELPLPSQDLLLAQELELQLNALIDWVNQQSAVKH